MRSAQQELQFLNDVLVKSNLNTPLALAFLLSWFAVVAGSKTGLRVWIALQQAPAPKQPISLPDGDDQVTEEAPVKKQSKFKYFLLRRVLPVIIGATVGFYLPHSGTPWLLLFFPLLSLVSISTIGHTTGSLTYSAHRLKSGRHVLLSVKGRGFRRTTFISGMVIAGLALWSKWPAFAWFIYTAYIFRMSMGTPEKSFSFGWALIPRAFSSMIMLTIFALYVVLGARNISRYAEVTARVWPSEIKGISDFSLVSLLPAMLVSMSGTIIAMALRFDYQNHLDTLDVDMRTAHADLEIVPNTNKFQRKLKAGDGAVLPPMAPRGFKKPYYLATLVTWCITNVAFLGAFSYAKSTPLAHFVDTTPVPMIIGFLVGPLSFLVMFTALCMTAIVRGEFALMARYKELWAIDVTHKDREFAQEQSVKEEQGKMADMKEKLEVLITI